MTNPSNIVAVTANVVPSPRNSRMLETYRVAEMVHHLPGIAHDTGQPGIIQQACVEVFFVHVRALIEFLEIKAPQGLAKKSDFFVSDIVPGWAPTLESVTRDRLVAHWTTASKHLMHFSKTRAVQDDGTVVGVDVSESALKGMADDLLDVWDQYSVAAGNHGLAPLRADFKMFSREYLGE